MLTGFKRSLAAAAVAGAALLPLSTPALAWRGGVVVGLGIPARVVVVPRVIVPAPVVLPQVMAVAPAYAHGPRYWVRGHHDARGFWIPGHWA